MATLVRTIRTRFPLFSFTTRGFFITLLVLGVIAMLFWLPDMVSVKQEAQNGEEAGSSSEQPMQQVRQEEASPFDQVYAILDASEREREQRRALESASPEERGSVWTFLRSEQTKNSLTKARGAAADIMGEIPAEAAAARFALSNYINMLDQILNAREGEFDPRKALEYLRTLDAEVSAQFSALDVGAEVRKKWAAVSLGEDLQQWENRDFRDSAVAPFAPNMRIINVNVLNMTAESRRKADPFDIKSSIEILGVVDGSETQIMKLYHNGRLVNTIRFSDRRYIKERIATSHQFSFTSYPATGTFVLEAIDAQGAKYRKAYRFVPRLYEIYPEKRTQDWISARSPNSNFVQLDRAFLIRDPNAGGSTRPYVAF